MKNSAVKACLYLVFPCLSVLNVSCGKENVFHSSYAISDKEKAQEAISSNNYDAAISILSDYISSFPNDYSAKSMIANVYLLKGGIHLSELIVSIQDNINTSNNDLYLLLNSFPTASTTNIEYINNAITYLNDIPTSELSSDQLYQTALAYAALAFYTIKLDVLDVSGTISISQASSMSITDCDTIYNSLVAVQSKLNQIGITAGSSSGSGIILSTINGITSTSGASNSAKLISYLISNS